MEEKLKELYTNPSNSAAFSSVDSLYQEAKKHITGLTRKDVVNFLEGEAAYTLHKPRRIHFSRSKTIPAGYLTNVQCDLADFRNVGKSNNGYRYLLVVVDLLSRQMYVAKLKTKKTEDVQKAFEEIFKQMPMLPHTIYTDKGLEFESPKMREFFREKEILKFGSKASIMKAAVAERAILTIKQRLYRYFTHKGTTKWTDVISKIVAGINNTRCRVTGMKPIEVNFSNAQTVWEKVYGKLRNTGRVPRYKSGDKVRMSELNRTFRKGYVQTWTEEIAEVDKAIKGQRRPPIYRIKDIQGEPMDARFYEEELQKVNQAKTSYIVKEKIKSRVVNGQREWLVRLVDYPGKFWVQLPD